MLESLVLCDLMWKSEEKALNRMTRKADAGLGVGSGTFQNGHVSRQHFDYSVSPPEIRGGFDYQRLLLIIIYEN